MEADEANNTKDIVIEEANGALGGDVSSSVDLSLEEPLFPALGKAAALQPSSLPGREEDGLGGSSATYGLY